MSILKPLTYVALLPVFAWTAVGFAAVGRGAERAAAASDTTAKRCSGAAFHQFDFWEGDWVVRNPQGKVLGHDQVHRVVDGCALVETWQGGGGGHGMSINTYDTDRGEWTQRWVGSGSTLWLLGGLEKGSMVLTGAAPRTTPKGKVLDRITWTPLPDGRVRQVWEISPDGGHSWTKSFEGLYSPMGGSAR